MTEILTIETEYGHMRLNLRTLFPRTKTWLNEFFRKAMHNWEDERDLEILDRLIVHLKEVEIPALPGKYQKLERDIEQARAEMMECPRHSPERLNADWRLKLLKSKKKSWPRYCAQFDMNLSVLEEYRKKRFGGKACEQY